MLCDPLSFGLINARDGQLFGAIALREGLNYDTEYGQLILSSCSSVLLTLADQAGDERPKVYEVEILPGPKLKDVVYVTLLETCVRELGMSNEMKVEVEIQFCLNRSSFVRMHTAVEAIRKSGNLPLLFPDSSAAGQPNRTSMRY